MQLPDDRFVYQDLGRIFNEDTHAKPYSRYAQIINPTIPRWCSLLALHIVFAVFHPPIQYLIHDP